MEKDEIIAFKRNGDGTVTIQESEWNSLVDDSYLLSALRSAGVDNWEGWDDAIEIFNSFVEDE